MNKDYFLTLSDEDKQKVRYLCNYPFQTDLDANINSIFPAPLPHSIRRKDIKWFRGFYQNKPYSSAVLLAWSSVKRDAKNQEIDIPIPKTMDIHVTNEHFPILLEKQFTDICQNQRPFVFFDISYFPK